MVDLSRLQAAYETVRSDLLAERNPQGHWRGELASSALSTATAVSALALVLKSRGLDADRQRVAEAQIAAGVAYLEKSQNADGGWGDTDRSLSNIATTMLVRAAIHLSDRSAQHATAIARAEVYLERQGGIAGLRRRYGRDKTFAVPILTNCALAGLAPWSEVASLPFELACLPQSWFRFARLPVVSYAIPALVAIGQAIYFHRPPKNPVVRAARAASLRKSLQVVRRMQPASGGFLEATPLTSFVVMSLSSIGQVHHSVTQHGAEFLLASAREDGSWPIDTDLATWNTTLSVNALASAGPLPDDLDCWDWLLSCQHTEKHPFTGAAAGGWCWSDLSGAVPDADDTPSALLALAKWIDPEISSAVCDTKNNARAFTAASAGIQWLLGLQNSDGGWPTFCRGWGALPFDRSAADLTAHAIRAFLAWMPRLVNESPQLVSRMQRAITRGFRFLARQQQPDGSWTPLWFGDQFRPEEDNPVYGTAKVLLAYRDAARTATPAAQRGLAWLANAQNPDNGWGSAGIHLQLKSGAEGGSSIEETALAVEALLCDSANSNHRVAAESGLNWLIEQVESNRHKDCSPIGFYFAKLWYYEKLYPLSFAVAALGQALQQQHSRLVRTATTAKLHR